MFIHPFKRHKIAIEKKKKSVHPNYIIKNSYFMWPNEQEFRVFTAYCSTIHVTRNSNKFMENQLNLHNYPGCPIHTNIHFRWNFFLSLFTIKKNKISEAPFAVPLALALCNRTRYCCFYSLWLYLLSLFARKAKFTIAWSVEERE